MNNQPTKSMVFRTNVIVFLACIAFICWIVTNLVKTSIAQNDYYQNLANSYQFGTINIPANRGMIYDRNDELLAISATVYKVFVDPNAYANAYNPIEADDDADADELLEVLEENARRKTEKKEVTEGLAAVLGMELSELESSLANTKSQYKIIMEEVEKPLRDDIIAFCDEHNVSFVHYEPDSTRYYPHKELAASVIGFVNSNGGVVGVENQYDEFLRGIDGKVISAKDANGAEMPYEYTKTYDAVDGNSVYLTLDITLQFYLEKHLTEVCAEQMPSEKTCGIIMNPKTGEVLAMATVPGFDAENPYVLTNAKDIAAVDAAQVTVNDAVAALNAAKDEEKEAAEAAVAEAKNAYSTAVGDANARQWQNKCISGLYYPGSVFKVFTGSAGLEESVIDLNTSFSCVDTVVAGTPFHCWKASGHGVQNFFQALANSCNPAFIDIGQKLGAEKFCYYFNAYGLSTRTGIDLPQEATSIYVPESRMGPVELASSSFGQTNVVTAIEMITAYAAVINGGYLLKPYVVDKIVDADGNVVLQNERTVVREVISEETSATMREALENVVSSNGGSNSYIKGYRIGAKSGTSQKQRENLEANRTDLYVSSYCCFTPADDPELIMLLYVDEPTTGDYYASIVAVPTATRVLEDVLPYLGYYPEYTDEEMLTLDITVPQLTGATVANAIESLKALGIEKYSVKGNGATVVCQVPEATTEIPVGGSVIIYTDDDYELEYAAVPDLTGKTIAEANELLSGLNYITTGASATRTGAVVIKQSVAAGEQVPLGTVIELEFAVYDESG